MPSIVSFSLLASAFGIQLAKAYNWMRPLDIFVFAYNTAPGQHYKPRERKLSKYVDKYLNMDYTGAALVQMYEYFNTMQVADPVLHFAPALYYDCGAWGETYRWPFDMETLSCHSEEPHPNWGKDTLIFVGLHQKDDYSVDIPEGIKLLLQTYRTTGGRVVFVSDGRLKHGLKGSSPNTGKRWTLHYGFYPIKSRSVRFYSMLPSVPPRGDMFFVPRDEKNFGGVESILHQVRQVMSSPPPVPPHKPAYFYPVSPHKPESFYDETPI